MRCSVLTALTVAACKFTPGSLQAGEGDASIAVDVVVGDGALADGNPDGAAPFVALHVPPTANMAGTAGLSFTATHSIDTTMLEIDGAAPPAGVTFDAQPQNPSGPELAVLHVTTLTLGSAAVVSVRGLRPLVVIASGDITIAGVLDASANANQPGASGGLPLMGLRPGATGQHVDPYLDGGGGGGGHATAGGVGGLASGSGSTANGGIAGLAAGDSQISVLVGGSGGGNGLGGVNGVGIGCQASGGAGGGAVQLSSPTQIVISGNGINVGGGGGQGGSGSCNNYGSPGGGGSGGSLVLQAALVQLNAGAVIAANGGGGGGGTTGGVNGTDGGDGLLSSAGGTFGAGVNQSSVNGGANGGPGGSATAPGPGVAHTAGGGNGGGGGGAAGRIAVVRSAVGAATLTGISSPAAVVSTY